MLIVSLYRAQNLRQGIVMKTRFKTRVLRMGLGSFVDINIFVYEIFFEYLNFAQGVRKTN